MNEFIYSPRNAVVSSSPSVSTLHPSPIIFEGMKGLEEVVRESENCSGELVLEWNFSSADGWGYKSRRVQPSAEVVS